MRKLKLLVLMSLLSFVAYGQARLEITIKKIKEHKGSIRVGLFNNENDFLKKVFTGKIAKADADEVTVVFENLKPGEYAVSLIHDENENGELDSNMFGIPKEGFAFGNNAMGTFGPPSFEKAKVVLKNDNDVQVLQLKYF